MSKVEFKGQEPEALFVVTYGNLWRVFSSEAQAMRWYNLKVNDGIKSTVFKYETSVVIARASGNV